MHDCTKRRGFSLMELLVVMVIIGLLISMLAPILIVARERARRTKAEAEVRTLETAWRTYYRTYDTLPSGTEMTAHLTSMLAGDSGAGNPAGIIFMEFTERDLANGFEDPWRKTRAPGAHLYQLEFAITPTATTRWTYQTRVHCMNHNRGKY